MSGEPTTADMGNSADGLAEQLRQLEEFVAKAESAGDALPPEAVEMVDKLRDIIQALEGLTSSFHPGGDSITLDEVSSATKDQE